MLATTLLRVTQTACSSALGQNVLLKGTEWINHMWCPLGFCFGVVWIWCIWVFLFCFLLCFCFSERVSPLYKLWLALNLPFFCLSLMNAELYRNATSNLPLNMWRTFLFFRPQCRMSHRLQFCQHLLHRTCGLTELQGDRLPRYCHRVAAPSS